MPAARHTDPQTSHEAAQSVRNLKPTQEIILDILRQYTLTDDMLVRLYESRITAGRAPYASQSGIRSRRAELVAAGLVKDSGARTKLPSGRNAIVWTVA